MPVFLTEEWFSQVETLTAQAGDLNLSPALQNLIINLIVSDSETGVKELSLAAGKLQKGLAEHAKTTLTMNAQTLRKVFLEFDMTAAMQAFMTGKIKVQGDMSQLMALQTAKPSPVQKELFRNILAHTQL
ncbi:SCP2 sterol-binding domain-containing protein [Acinetobacter rathckeae]|uniref:SCP2 sterol-binding domain-containing protein n=1 Tax=Acinetobacter rathckeae TaxID=2605272 RepID=UPI0018A2CB21|nr:SCP2 sterol-binding domain-containing protein [Acinetobacter rathckeae]MBF7687530.1 SCP2 sterol-binding domain-containing protein [Acinetobacter rathckeae]MBF7694932.1 SCP2 sterol-binding domain-containing protein [Acinetobacter rathckeae]